MTPEMSYDPENHTAEPSWRRHRPTELGLSGWSPDDYNKAVPKQPHGSLQKYQIKETQPSINSNPTDPQETQWVTSRQVL